MAAQVFMELFADWAVGAAVRQSSYDPESVVVYEVRGFTAHCENNLSQPQLFDQHATERGAGLTGTNNATAGGVGGSCVMSSQSVF